MRFRDANRPVVDPHASEHLTAPGRLALLLVAAVPMLAAVGYGAVDVWALIPLSLFTGLLILFWAADSLRSGQLRYSIEPAQLPLVGILLLALVQLLPLRNGGEAALTLDPFSTGYFAIRIFLLLLFFAAALRFIHGKRVAQRIAVAVIVFGAALAFVGIVMRLVSPEAIYGMRPTPQAIPFSPFVNQHHFAAFMEMTVGLTVAFLLGGGLKSDRRALLLIALSLMLIAVMMTGSRGGFISIAAVFAFAAAAIYFDRPRRTVEHRTLIRTAAIIAPVLLTAAAAAVFISGADPLTRGLGVENTQADFTSGRTHFWSVAWQIFLNHPIVGAGLDAFGVAFTRYDTWNGFFRVEQAHNDYLQMLADGGVIGFALAAAFIFLLFKRGAAAVKGSTSPGRRSIAVGALAGCFGVLVHSFFDFPLRTLSNSYFFLLLAALAMVDLGDERGTG